jgi:hypothetical protein
MSAILTFLNNNKTYIVAILTGVFAALQVLGITVPGYVYAVLAAFGFGVVHTSITKLHSTVALMQEEQKAAAAKPAAKAKK